ncbi:hypothetical protein L1049_023927 [Liquidambar formosana]|uniref:Helicase ATP-binding domain-containing protein n=1 Tax=Liquidambar formosana TaxID=63359 RepID=A0AAP0S124_LIQFO
MDKSWITLDRVSDAYQAGLKTFLDYVEANASVGGIMYCPCRDCINTKRGNRDFVRLHLTRRGWAPGYALMTWTFHGESDLIRSLDNMSDEGDDSEEGGDDIRGILHDTFHIPSPAGQGIVVTNDGNAILWELDVAHPAAKSMIELSRTQDEEVGDGTTSVIVLGKCLHPSIMKDSAFHEYTRPTSIQDQAMSVALSGRDLLGCAKTGRGKTAAFTIPMIQHCLAQTPIWRGDGPLALVLAPTRELAQQIQKEVRKLLVRCNNVGAGQELYRDKVH